jgi:hypothetical protein
MVPSANTSPIVWLILHREQMMFLDMSAESLKGTRSVALVGALLFRRRLTQKVRPGYLRLFFLFAPLYITSIGLCWQHAQDGFTLLRGFLVSL